MKKKLRVLVLMHKELLPPSSLEGTTEREREAWKTEYDVVSTLRKGGHEVIELGAGEELGPIREGIKECRPDIVFNLLEDFQGGDVYAQHVVACLELMRQPYTGCNPRGLMLAGDKAIAKKILLYHRVRVPAFVVFSRGRVIRRPRRLTFPLIVKSVCEEASQGISQASVVDTDEKMVERVRFIFEKIGTDAIVEEYIEGREVYVGVLGTRRLEVLPPWELILDDLPVSSFKIATEKVKWDKKYQDRHNISWRKAALGEEAEFRLERLSRRIYRALNLSGYGRLDFRLSAGGELYLLEANANPNIARDDEFAVSAVSGGLSYFRLLDRILRLGIRDMV